MATGIVLQNNGMSFTSPNLPVRHLEYKGITASLVAAYQLRRGTDPSLMPVAGTAGVASVIGIPTWGVNSMLGSGDAGIDSGVALGNEFSLFAVFRRPFGTNYSFGAAATYAERGLRLAATSTGWRAQVGYVDGANISLRYAEADFSALDALSTDVTRYEFLALTLKAGSGANDGVRFFIPRLNVTVYKSFNLTPDPEQSAATVTYATEKVTGYSGSACEVVACGQFSRQLTPEEIATQYTAMKNYCETVGINI